MIAQGPAQAARGDTRERILETARRLFTERGYFNTSIQDIRQASGLSIGSIYHHFQGKEDIARTLYYETLAFVKTDVGALVEEYATARERCYHLVAHLFELTEQAPEMMEYTLHFKHREVLPHEPPVCFSEPFELFKRIMAEGMESGEVRPMETVLASAAFLGGPIRLVQLRLDGVLEHPLPEYLQGAWECAWAAVAVDPATG